MNNARSALDPETPNVARVYDYLLGGKENYAADRAAAAQLTALTGDPGVVLRSIRENRAFLGRAVRFLADIGVRQFLDIGAGLPTQGNVHEVAQAAAPGARVVYVDNDPVVLAHGRALLATSPEVGIADADLRDPAGILDHPVVREMIDFDQPVAVLLVAVLHFIAEHEKPGEIVAQLRDALPAGSYLVISHGVGELWPEDADVAEAVYNQASAQLTLRTTAAIRSFFDGFALVEPGLVDVTAWRPDQAAGPVAVAVGVGRKE